MIGIQFNLLLAGKNYLADPRREAECPQDLNPAIANERNDIARRPAATD